MKKHQMQARSSSSGRMISWVTDAPDWKGVKFPGPGSPEFIALSSTFDDGEPEPGPITPSIPITIDDGGEA